MTTSITQYTDLQDGDIATFDVVKTSIIYPYQPGDVLTGTVHGRKSDNEGTTDISYWWVFDTIVGRISENVPLAALKFVSATRPETPEPVGPPEVPGTVIEATVEETGARYRFICLPDDEYDIVPWRRAGKDNDYDAAYGYAARWYRACELTDWNVLLEGAV